MSTGRLGAGDTAIQPTIFDAKADILTATAADTPARLAVGSNNQVLTVDSSTATGLKWATPTDVSGMTLLSTTTLSGTTVSITGISGSYNDLQILVVGADKAGAIRPNGSSSSAQYIQNYMTTTTITQTGVNNNEWRLNAGDGMSSNNQGTVVLYIYNYAGTNFWKAAMLFGGFTGTSHNTTLQQIGMHKSTSAITSIDIVSDSGSFGGGTVLIYGVK
jgi:hypothetical protein